MINTYIYVCDKRQTRKNHALIVSIQSYFMQQDNIECNILIFENEEWNLKMKN